MAFKNPKFRKFAKKVEKGLGKRYFRGKRANLKNANIKQMASDVARLKHLLNVEKKVILRQQQAPQKFGLIVSSSKTTAADPAEAVYSNRDNALYSGAYVEPNLIGNIPRGDAGGELIGDRCKLVSFHLDYRITALESSLASANTWYPNYGDRVKAKLFLVCIPRGNQVLTDGITATNVQEVLLEKFFSPDAFDNVYSGKQRNISHVKDFKVLARRDITFTFDETTDGSTTETRYNKIREGSMGGKLDMHLRYEGTDLIKNQLALIAIADHGNVSALQGNDNHLTLEYKAQFYYVDN